MGVDHKTCYGRVSESSSIWQILKNGVNWGLVRGGLWQRFICTNGIVGVGDKCSCRMRVELFFRQGKIVCANVT